MTAPHPFLSIHSRDQWRRVAHRNTELTVEQEGVRLSTILNPPSEPTPLTPLEHAPAAFDPHCRLFRALPEEGEVWMWRDVASRAHPEPVPVFAPEPALPGDFEFVKPAPKLRSPRGLTVDGDGRLFVAETDTDQIRVFDLVDRRLIRSIVLPDGSRPGDCHANGFDVYVTTTLGLGVTGVATDFRLLPGELSGRVFDRVAASGSLICVLEDAGLESARIIPWDHPEYAFESPFATDIEFVDTRRLMVARGPGDLLEEYLVSSDAGQWVRQRLRVLRAKGYDGRGIVRTPDGRIGFFGARGFRYAMPVRPRYQTRGRVVSFALDSGAYQNNWGLVFVDACLPRGCSLQIRFHTDDDEPEFRLLDRLPAENDAGFGDLPAPDRSPPMPKEKAFIEFEKAHTQAAGKLFRRGVDDELVWDQFGDDERLVTYEAPVVAAPGRYLWVTLELTGSGRETPFVHALRVQKHGHDLLQHLPSLFSRSPAVASFLRRYLAMPEAMLTEFDVAAFTRHVLLDPYSCPEEWLPWLARFVGLVFDERFEPDIRRQLVAEAIWLFRFRGTVQGLRRFLEIYTKAQVMIVERFKLRGHAAYLDDQPSGTETGAALGVGYRLGSGSAGETDTADGEVAGDDRYAHRFTVIIAAALSTDELDTVNHIIAVHRPAHTGFDVCTVDAGMRIGRGLYLQINSIVGQSGGFGSTYLDAAVVGRHSVLGIPKTVSTTSGGRLGMSARLG